jgi:hypothetical protein
MPWSKASKMRNPHHALCIIEAGVVFFSTPRGREVRGKQNAETEQNHTGEAQSEFQVFCEGHTL